MQEKKRKKIAGKLIENDWLYSTREVLAILNLGAERFRKWIIDGNIKPNIHAKGTGRTHFFSRENIYAIAVFTKLVDMGLNRAIASDIAHHWKARNWNYVSTRDEDMYLVITGDVTPKKERAWQKKMKFEVNENPHRIIVEDAKRTGFELALIVNLYKIAKEVDSQLD
jgi:hypothetical protein